MRSAKCETADVEVVELFRPEGRRDVVVWRKLLRLIFRCW